MNFPIGLSQGASAWDGLNLQAMQKGILAKSQAFDSMAIIFQDLADVLLPVYPFTDWEI